MFASGKVKINSTEASRQKIIKGETTRIIQFQDDMVNCGTLRGFKHFMTQLRSRDELLIKLFKDPLEAQKEANSESATSESNLPVSAKRNEYTDAVVRAHVNSYPTLRASSIKSISKSTLLKLEKAIPGGSSRTSKFTAWSGLPISEIQTHNDTSKSTFLLGAYMKRKVPMVWLLADQHSLGTFSSATSAEPLDLDEEDPLILKSLLNWYKDEVSFLDVFSEILCTSLSNTPKLNPFEINFEYLLHLPNEELLILIPSIVSFLTKLLTKVPFIEQVLSDIEELHLLQLNCLESLNPGSNKKSSLKSF